MLRFVTYALPLLVLLLALFGFAVDILDFEPQRGSVIKLASLDQPTVPAQLVFGVWLVEASGLLALFLLAQGRCGVWWLDGLVAGWLGWVFRGPLLVVTIVVAARQPQHAWWSLAFGWWVLYSICGLSLAILARRTDLDLAIGASGAEARHQASSAKAARTQDAISPSGVLASPAPDAEGNDRRIAAMSPAVPDFDAESPDTSSSEMANEAMVESPLGESDQAEALPSHEPRPDRGEET